MNSLPVEAFTHLNSSLRGLSLGGRFLTCDCKIKWIATWIRKYDLQVTSRERNPQFCGNPLSLRERSFYQLNENGKWEFLILHCRSRLSFNCEPSSDTDKLILAYLCLVLCSLPPCRNIKPTTYITFNTETYWTNSDRPHQLLAEIWHRDKGPHCTPVHTTFFNWLQTKSQHWLHSLLFLNEFNKTHASERVLIRHTTIHDDGRLVGLQTGKLEQNLIFLGY